MQDFLVVVDEACGIEEGADVSKLRSIVLGEDGYGAYGEDVREALKGVEACIWTVAVTPSKSKKMNFADLKRICLDHTMLGLRTLDEARGEGMEPLMFVPGKMKVGPEKYHRLVGTSQGQRGSEVTSIGLYAIEMVSRSVGGLIVVYGLAHYIKLVVSDCAE
ncbi:NAD(P)-binding Rossmann-fold containing protein [Venturia nashicola]|uniref:NAD(P)-binding Rossmann-fold containing protein n=1 Tax=Venturia nashicola TaxID=86259 RepID=A0A4Z1NS89_9PEZI|nr:NAD(P)-binding Rossmann-fold containing protein [Venturia nashicola]